MPMQVRTGVTTATIEQPATGINNVYWLEAGDASIHRQYMITPGMRLVIGSRSDCDMVLSDPWVSGRHCEVKFNTWDRSCHRGELMLQDLGSKNGTYVGGVRLSSLSSAQLIAGACFVVGGIPISVRGHEIPAYDTRPLDGMVGTSAAMLEVASQVRKFARLSVPVLICGATGTGKEMVARALHDLSRRNNGPFCPLNLGAIPSQLAAAELFGHKRGAFTDAQKARRGAFVAAEKGTLFLDEIGEISQDVQVMLLRTLEQHEVQPLGSDKRIAVDVRVIAATWNDLEKSVQRGTFRRDLYHRLVVGTVQLPALSERKTDIPALANHIVKLHEHEIGPKSLAPGAIARLMCYSWPGNVRELFNVVLRAAANSPATWIQPSDIDTALGRGKRVLSQLTPQSARALVKQCGGSISAAARKCNVPRTTFRCWLQAKSRYCKQLDEALERANYE